MKFPRITKKTKQGFRADLLGDDESLNPSALLKKMKEHNPELAGVIANFSEGNPNVAGRLLYICEIIERQMESDKMAEDFQ